MKHLLLLLFLGCLITSCCSAQDLDDKPPPPPPPPRVPTVAVTFIANDTCSLRINKNEYGEIVKNKSRTIDLPFGNYRLFFESLETGETLIKRSFRLIRDSITGGKFTYQVTFKQQN